MDREALVHVDLDGVPHLMGPLWARTRKNKERATFEYDKTWLENPARFSLEPALQVGPGPFHTAPDTPMFGAIGDSAPDRWGPARERVIDADIEAKLLPFCKRPLRDVLMIMRDSGMRNQKEVFRMRWEHLDWANKRYFV